MKSWRFYLVTFGCKVNQYETQSIREVWTRHGGIECVEPHEADIALVNSCAVTAKGERDARNALHRLRRVAPEAARILTGCAAPLVAQATADCVDLMVPPRAKALLLQDPRELLRHHGRAALAAGRGVRLCGGAADDAAMPGQMPAVPADLPEQPTDGVYVCGGGGLSVGGVVPPFGPQGFCIRDFRRARPVVKVQDGCSRHCTYCVVPIMRGPALSRDPGEVLDEVRHLFEAGFGEVMLSGVNLQQYRIAEDDTDEDAGIWKLLQLLDHELGQEFAGQARVRVSSLDPAGLTPQAVDALSLNRLVCPHLHLSLQHASPNVLKRMGRRPFREEALLDVVHSLRNIWPHMGLGADVLLGFPGERDEDVVVTADYLRELGITYAHVFPYSPRPQTPAANYGEQVPHVLKLQRAARIRALAENLRLQHLEDLATLPRLSMLADSPTPSTEAHAGRHSPCAVQHPTELEENEPIDEGAALAAGHHRASGAPRANASADVPGADAPAASQQATLRGVSGQYAALRLLIPEGGVPEAARTHQLLDVRPLRVEDGLLLVECL